MARRRIMEYGPSVRTPRISMQPISAVRENPRKGVILRNPPGVVIGHSDTVKSRMGVRPHRGIRMPGQQAADLTSPYS